MVIRRSRTTAVSALLALAVLASGCTDDGKDATPKDRKDEAPAAATAGPTEKATGEYATDLDIEVGDEKTVPATFTVRPGTEEVTVTGVKPKQRISLVTPDGKRLVVLKADRFGQAHFAYLPTKLAEYQTGGKAKLPTAEGFTVVPGEGYTVRNEDTDPVEASDPFTILGRDDHPDQEFYDDQIGDIGPSGDETSAFGYATMRDGVKLSLNVRLPGPASDGPYPTVIEYSGYGPANPDATEPGSMIAGLLGYATVGVNMRGTGCSGGVFDVFNAAQQVDGYDVVEAIAAQPWVKGNKVGMVGLSYSGITQLYTAATNPPHLAAVTSLSVIKDPWLQQWPGGVYNGGFTKQWLNERDRQSSAGGTSWVAEKVEEGDEDCVAHQELREQNIDFEAFGRSLVRRPELADDRDLSKLVRNIDVPVYLSGAWQDEQTGPQFADMLGNFDNAPVKRFTLFNGRHPDGYTPMVLTRWFEFLELYVDGVVPRLDPGIRAAAPVVFAENFGVDGLSFEEDRFADFADDDYDGVRAAYEAEPDVRVLFENGVGMEGTPGAPEFTFEQSYETWPPADLEPREFYLGSGQQLLAEAEPDAAVDTFAHDADAGSEDFFGEKGYELLAPRWDFDWTSFADGDALSYVSAPFDETVVLGGPGYADLTMEIPDGDADVQVSLNLVRADGTEWHVTSGLLRLSDRAYDEGAGAGLQVERTYAEDVAEDMPVGDAATARVALPSFAQAVRPGDRIRVTISSPGRDFGAWLFETIGEDGTERRVTRGGPEASKLVVGVLPDIDPADVPDIAYPCPSLRGQACRPFVATTNRTAES